MQKAPILIISREQGVPIPGNSFCVNLAKNQFSELTPVDIEFRDTIITEVFLIGLSKETYLGYCLLLTNEERIDSIENIGVICTLKEVENSGIDVKITCKVLTRAIIDKEQVDLEELNVPLRILKNKNISGEEDMVKDLHSLIVYLPKNNNRISKELRAKLLTVNDIRVLTNTLANILAIPYEDKLKYLLQVNNFDKFTLILRYLIKTLAENPSQPRPPPRERIMPPPIETVDLFIENSYESEEEEEEEKSLIKMPSKALKKWETENNRLHNLPKSSMEYQALAEYIEWLTAVPWGCISFQKADLTSFITALNKTHYGLKEVKEHILEYMTIEQISGTSQGSTLCFAGPPGTGKTSIAKQIAKATNRQIIKIAFGGMTDEAEIRGHRRTYVAAKPGRIVTGLTETGTMDPLFLLDEVDKIGGHKADPISALLELLDPEQNSEFIDRYLEVGIDLSKAMFICTANYLDQIPPPLKDRLEIIKFRDYSYEEKIVIAKDFLLTDAIEEYKLIDFKIRFEDGAIESICKTSTIREIQRKIKKLLRKAAVSIEVHNKDSFLITTKLIEETFQKMGEKRLLGFHS